MEEAAVKEAARAFVAEAGRYVAAQYAALAAARGGPRSVPASVEVAYKDAGASRRPRRRGWLRGAPRLSACGHRRPTPAHRRRRVGRGAVG